MEFIRSGFTKSDLEKVLTRLLRLVYSGERRVESLKFSNVVEGLDRFEEELALIRAEGTEIKVGERQFSVWELQQIIGTKRAEAERLKDEFASEDSFGWVWSDPNARKQYQALMQQIRELTAKIARLA